MSKQTGDINGINISDIVRLVIAYIRIDDPVKREILLRYAEMHIDD